MPAIADRVRTSTTVRPDGRYAWAIPSPQPSPLGEGAVRAD